MALVIGKGFSRSRSRSRSQSQSLEHVGIKKAQPRFNIDNKSNRG